MVQKLKELLCRDSAWAGNDVIDCVDLTASKPTIENTSTEEFIEFNVCELHDDGFAYPTDINDSTEFIGIKYSGDETSSTPE